jgi:hypothetical protein
MRCLCGVIIVVFIHQQLLWVVILNGSALSVVQVRWGDPLGVAVDAFSGYRDGGLRLGRQCW